MSDSDWQGDGPDFSVDLAGRRWSLKVDDPQPALSWSDGRSPARLLGLWRVSTAGRRDDRAFHAPSLVAFEHHRQRVQATFAPREWPELSIRAAWELSPSLDGVDLEIQASSSSFEVLRGLEVTVGSRWLEAGGGPGRTYFEMVRPDDCVRRPLDEADAPEAATPGAFAIRHVLFGHDLEKGVVLRGRIRGLWIASDSPDFEVRRLYERFLAEPPALGP